MPEWVTAASEIGAVQKRFERQVKALTKAAVDDAMADGDGEKPRSERKVTVLHDMVHSKTLPPAEKKIERLENDAAIFIGAGMETTGK